MTKTTQKGITTSQIKNASYSIIYIHSSPGKKKAQSLTFTSSKNNVTLNGREIQSLRKVMALT